MTGGACSGFSVATGAPISGILFAIEEAHQRVSPMIFMVATVSVSASYITTELIAPILGVSPTLFPSLSLRTLTAVDLWIPLVVGAVLGLFAVLFLRYYKAISSFVTTKLVKIPAFLRFFAIFVVTLLFGLLSHSFISTCHHLIVELLTERRVFYMLLLILAVRMLLTVFANTNSLTGGIFLPLMAIGTLVSALVAELALALGLPADYYTVIITLGITACIAGMMKMPLTAIVFAIEALSSHNNIIHIILVSLVAFAITEIFEAKSVNDSVLEHRIHTMHKGERPKVIDTFVTVEENSFAVGKQIRDILWPANLFVLSLKRGESGAIVDQHGGEEMRAGDILHVRYSTYNEADTREELMSIINEQDFDEHEDEVI
jgi:H+/Cl- antiporter ClcA